MIVKATYARGHVLTSVSDLAREIHYTYGFGLPTREKCIQLSLIETLYLLEKGKIELADGRGRLITPEMFLAKAMRQEKNFWARYHVFSDLRSRGYIIKTALKFGADFRVYDRGVKPGEDHARWIVYPVRESDGMTWHAFSAKNRVAHSTKKRLLVGVVDDEGEVTYYEVSWLKP